MNNLEQLTQAFNSFQIDTMKRLAELESKPQNILRELATMNKTNIDRLDMILKHHSREIDRLSKSIVDLLPVKQPIPFWKRVWKK